jgi:hypothetical protein
MAAKREKSVRAWVGEGGSPTQAAEHPSGSFIGRRNPQRPTLDGGAKAVPNGCRQASQRLQREHAGKIRRFS